MKLRCVSNSIRLRVRKSDLKTLGETGEIKERIAFPGGSSLIFALSVGDYEGVAATFDEKGLNVCLPLKEAEAWVTSAEVRIETYLALEDGAQLHILIEKDFPCKHTDDAELADTFSELVPTGAMC